MKRYELISIIAAILSIGSSKDYLISSAVPTARNLVLKTEEEDGE